MRCTLLRIGSLVLACSWLACSTEGSVAFVVGNSSTHFLVHADEDGVDENLDCNDADPNNWSSCLTCDDADFDGWWIDCDAYVTIAGPDCEDSIFGCTDNCAIDDNDNQIGDCIECDAIDTDADEDSHHLWYCNGFDCDDTDPGEWFCTACVGHVPIDADEDGICRDLDCDDQNPSVWESCETCVDEDEDRYWVGCDNYNDRLGPDCDDELPQCNATCATDDADEDGVGSECGNGPDCDDSNPNAWDSCLSCNDLDGDEFWFGCDDYATVDGPDCDDLHAMCSTDCLLIDVDEDGAYVDPCGVAGDCDDGDPLLTTLCEGCEDDDQDGYYVNCTTPIVDCDDTDPGVGPACGVSCVDEDLDGYCAINDCDDEDENNWSSCGSCVDGDSDGLFVACDRYVSIREDCNDTSSSPCSAASLPRPIIECATSLGGGGTRVVFGYEGHASNFVDIAVGEDNVISPGADYQGQPTQFFAGRRDSVFAVDFPSTTAEWTLNGQTVELTLSTPTCPSSHCPPGQGATVDQKCLPMSPHTIEDSDGTRIYLAEDIPTGRPTFASAQQAIAYIRERVTRFGLGTIDEASSTSSFLTLRGPLAGRATTVDRRDLEDTDLEDNFGVLVGGRNGTIEVGTEVYCVSENGCSECPGDLTDNDGCSCGGLYMDREGDKCVCVVPGSKFVGDGESNYCVCYDGTAIDEVTGCAGHGPPAGAPGTRGTISPPLQAAPIPEKSAPCDPIAGDFCLRGESKITTVPFYRRASGKTSNIKGGYRQESYWCFAGIFHWRCYRRYGTNDLGVTSSFYDVDGRPLGLPETRTAHDRPDVGAHRSAIGLEVCPLDEVDCRIQKVCSSHWGSGDATTRTPGGRTGTVRQIGYFNTGKSCTNF